MSQPQSFAQTLLHYLNNWQDHPGAQPVAAADLQQMMVKAAAETIAQIEQGGEIAETVLLNRVVSPDDLLVSHELAIGPDSLLLGPAEVALLRALLLSYDETAGPRLGDRLTMPSVMEGGRVVSEVTEEMLEAGE